MQETAITPTQNTNAEAGETWLRLPPAGKNCPRSGMKRGMMLALAKANPDRIKTAYLRQPGQKKGTWLIHWPSLAAFISGEADRTREQLTAGEIGSLPDIESGVRK